MLEGVAARTKRDHWMLVCLDTDGILYTHKPFVYVAYIKALSVRRCAHPMSLAKLNPLLRDVVVSGTDGMPEFDDGISTVQDSSYWWAY